MTVEALHQRYDYGRLPPHLQGGVRRYIEEGIPPGDFLTAVITNNLRLAVGHADSTSLAALTDIVRFFYNEPPGGCWGTPEKMKAWMQTGHKKNIV
tara:strand:- start:34 stop:321 length:288 start_codon:yes stop_codon:yes gene_type:complete